MTLYLEVIVFLLVLLTQSEVTPRSLDRFVKGSLVLTKEIDGGMGRQQGRRFRGRGE